MEVRSKIGEFFREGFVVLDVSSRRAFDKFYGRVVSAINESFDLGFVENCDQIDRILGQVTVNEVRLKIIERLNQAPAAFDEVFEMVEPYVETIIGSDVAIQRRFNVSIIDAGDTSSHLDIHRDIESGETPFEVNLWLPLTSPGLRNGLFLLPREDSITAIKTGAYRIYQAEGREGLTKRYKDKLVWPSVDIGQALLFSPLLFHGSMPHSENTRLSINHRFKHIFAPARCEEKNASFFKVAKKSRFYEFSESLLDLDLENDFQKM